MRSNTECTARQKVSLHALFVLVPALLVFPLFSENRPERTGVGCCNIVPNIPGPGIRPENVDIRNVKEFPFAVFTGIWEMKPAESECERTSQQQKMREDLFDLLHLNSYYRFGENCPLVKLQSGTEAAEFRISCLGQAPATRFSLVFLAGSNDTDRRYLFSLPTGREITGIFQLKNYTIQAGNFRWQWHETKVNYKNPFLEILRSQNPSMTETELLTTPTISRSIALIFQQALSRSALTNRWIEEFQTVMPKDRSIRFEEACPLIVREAPRRAAGEDRFRLDLSISCAPHSLDRVSTLLTPENIELLRDIRRGSRLYGELRFQGILKKDDQFYLEWDTISNIRQAPQSGL